MELINFNTAIEEGEIINKDGYHKPDNYPYHMSSCGCKKTTPKGAYRDVSVEMDNGTIVHFYHQTPVVVEKNGTYKLNNGGYETSTTKERINRYSPFRVFQRDFVWYVNYKDETLEFENGMELEA